MLAGRRGVVLLPSVPSAGQNVLGHHFCSPVESAFWPALCSRHGKPPTCKRSTCIQDAWLDGCGVEGTVRFLSGLTIPMTASRPRSEAACLPLGQATGHHQGCGNHQTDHDCSIYPGRRPQLQATSSPLLSAAGIYLPLNVILE